MKKIDKKHESFMRWAIALALEGVGFTSPNPCVGAVVVKNGKIVGEGFHKKAGLSHAEIIAIEDAGAQAKGADIYVTLEPCVHEGRTPACVPAIHKAGIKRVFVGTRDPNKVVCGKGIAWLKSLKIDVVEGILEESCAKINEPYNKYMSKRLPHVTVKVALSLDGKISTYSGDSKWITNDECRKFVHKLRSQVDAVLVGKLTYIKDNPLLNVRLDGENFVDPFAVIVDENLKILPSGKIFRERKKEIIIATTSLAPGKRIEKFKKLGACVIVCKKNKNGLVDLKDMLYKLASLEIQSVLVEGGGEIFSEFFKNKLVDRVVACIAPKIIGGDGRDFLPGTKIKNIDECLKLRDLRVSVYGDNVVVDGKIAYSV